MRKIAILFASTLLISLSAFAGSGTSINTKSLTKAINAAKATAAEKGSYAIVYGGKDMSHSIVELDSSSQESVQTA